MMKVLVVSEYDVVGGASRAARRLHLSLREKGVESVMGVRRVLSGTPGVTKLSPRLPGRVASVLQGIYNRRLVAFKGRNAREKPEIFSHTRARIRPDWREILAPFDIVNLHWLGDMLNLDKLFSALGKHQKVVWTLHDMNPFTGGCHYAGNCRRFEGNCGKCPQLGSMREGDLSRTGHSRKRLALGKLADHQLAVVTPSRWLGEQSKTSSLLGRFEHRVIPNSLETDIYRPGNRREIRGKLNIGENESVLLMLSFSLDAPRKGMDLLLQALGRLPHNEKLCLLTVGAGGCDVPGTRVINLGELDSDQQICEAYNAADLFVAPSREDNLPNTVLEAMACGTPSVAFDIGGMPDMIEPGETGLLAKPEDPKDLARCISEMLAHPELGGSMREQCRRTAVHRYSLERQAAEYIGLFREIL